MVLSNQLQKNGERILVEWLDEQFSNSDYPKGIIKEGQLKSESKQFLSEFLSALSSEQTDTESRPWTQVREFLMEISKSRALLGFSPAQTATFVFSLKSPLFKTLRNELSSRPDELFESICEATKVLDKLGLYTTECFQRTRENIINRQQQEMLELSTPVVKLWDGVLALPMIGTLDSGRTQVVMETLLQKIVEEAADVAIIDITGVPTVDTLVAQHLMKTVTAAKLMGAECIISGIRPQIAQTIVHLGVELQGVATKANLADALKLAMQRRGLKVVAQAKA